MSVFVLCCKMRKFIFCTATGNLHGDPSGSFDAHKHIVKTYYQRRGQPDWLTELTRKGAQSLPTQ